jgi:hypothetical protein
MSGRDCMPVIAHTAFGDVYRQSLERVGCETIIHKPSSPTVLLEAIDQLLGDREATRDDRRVGGGRPHLRLFFRAPCEIHDISRSRSARSRRTWPGDRPVEDRAGRSASMRGDAR